MSVTPEISFEVARLTARELRSRRAFHRVLAGGSPGARVVTFANVEALLVPVCPWMSMFNCVFSYEGAGALQEALPQLADEYARAGVKAWRVWVPSEDQATIDLLGAAGFRCGGAILRMASRLASQDLEPRTKLNLVRSPTWQMVALCNDRAYGLPAERTLARAFVSLHDPASHLYVVQGDGEPIAALVAREHEGDVYHTFVATVPEAQRMGIGEELVRLAKRAARQRGCETSSGESTATAERLYRKGGAHLLGELQVWEHPLPIGDLR